MVGIGNFRYNCWEYKLYIAKFLKFLDSLRLIYPFIMPFLL